jgi:hypothetical protein
VHQREEGDRNQEELRNRSGLGDAHHALVSDGRAKSRYDDLHDCDQQGEDQREMSEFNDHGISL